MDNVNSPNRLVLVLIVQRQHVETVSVKTMNVKRYALIAIQIAEIVFVTSTKMQWNVLLSAVLPPAGMAFVKIANIKESVLIVLLLSLAEIYVVLLTKIQSIVLLIVVYCPVVMEIVKIVKIQ